MFWCGQGYFCAWVHYCHRPIIVTDVKTLLGKVMPKLKVNGKSATDDVIDNDLILLWSDDKRVITGTDILGRLLRGITHLDLKIVDTDNESIS